MSEKKKATIKNWRLVEVRRQFIIGEVFGNPKFPDGEAIRTSDVVRWIDDNTAETLNTVYTLEDPAP